MSLITCSGDCIYQKDGFCVLDNLSTVRNSSSQNCAHYIKLGSKK